MNCSLPVLRVATTYQLPTKSSRKGRLWVQIWFSLGLAGLSGTVRAQGSWVSLLVAERPAAFTQLVMEDIKISLIDVISFSFSSECCGYVLWGKMSKLAFIGCK